MYLFIVKMWVSWVHLVNHCGVSHCWQAKLYLAVIPLYLPHPMAVLRAWMFVPAVQGQHLVTTWESKWETGCFYVKIQWDNCQNWQHLYFEIGSLMVDAVERCSQPGAHPQRLPFQGHKCGQAPQELQESSRLGGIWKGSCHWWIMEWDTTEASSGYKTQGIFKIRTIQMGQQFKI